MYYPNGLEYIIQSSYSTSSYFGINYFSKISTENYSPMQSHNIDFEMPYKVRVHHFLYKSTQKYLTIYITSHSFTPELFLNPVRPTSRFVVDTSEIKSIAEETMELITQKKLPANISISILPFDEFKILHSRFGSWNDGILGFSLNGNSKKIFVRENNLDALMLVLGHEIGHVLTNTLPNKHDEEAKAFAFSVEWAKAIKKHNIANLGLSIKDEIDFQPARNGLHDIASGFVDLMIKKGRKAISLHDDLARGYLSIFNEFYC